MFIETAPGSDYKFLCPSYPVTQGTGSPSINLPLVHESWSGSKVPPGVWGQGASISGTVSTQVNGQMEPLAGATVTLDNGIQDPPGITNSQGFYMTCSAVGGNQLRTVTAEKAGFRPVMREIFGGGGFISFELLRE